MAKSGIEMFGLKKFEDRLKKMRTIPLSLDKGIVIIASTIATNYVNRTLAGKDKNGGNFKAYSPQYKKHKPSTARPSFVSNTVNLASSGDMLNSIRVQTTRKEGTFNQTEIFIASKAEEQKAILHQYGSSGSANVKEHNRKIKQAFGKKIKAKTIKIKSHSRKSNLPKREFFGLSQRNRIYANNELERLLRNLEK